MDTMESPAIVVLRKALAYENESVEYNRHQVETAARRQIESQGYLDEAEAAVRDIEAKLRALGVRVALAELVER